ncbi:MAG: hypothetical protein JSV91_00105 [Phycisphaerales bacterium]|nr:MAG: hypothetical protein JSV91_00105 [Phycisphaerales bacterium]
MRRTTAITAGLALALCGSIAGASNVPSSTMYFHGELTDEGGGVYSGVVAMIDEGAPDAGYDVYGKNGATAWFGDDSGGGPIWTSVTIASHDAWPTWTPDTPDWYQYSLNLYVDGGVLRWAVRNHPGATEDHPWYDEAYWGAGGKPPMGVPMSGTMDWDRMYALETDTGAYLPGTGTPEIPGGAAGYGGGAGAWDMDWSWGSEVVPLEMPGFEVQITDLGGGEYDISLTPWANTAASGTMEFEGELSAKGPALTGTIPMTAGSYYVAGGDGEHISTGGGFDVLAQEGGVAYVQGYYGTGWWNDNYPPGDNDTFVIGPRHDAYPSQQGGGPWGSWYDPDCADYGMFELELTADHWYLRYAPTGESPMSGTMDWDTMYAAETDLGTQDGGHDGSAAHGGGGGAWDWDCGWGVEVVPLELPGFYLNIEEVAKGNYHVTMTPSSPPEVPLNAPTCNTSGQVEVTIDMPDMAKQVAGGQFFLTYDNTVLTYAGHSAGDYPFDTVVYWDHDPGAGTIAISVGDPFGGYTNQATRMATLTFDVASEVCSEADLVQFDTAHEPPSMLSEPGGIPIYPTLTDLYAISTDQTAPSLTAPAMNVAYLCLDDVPFNDWLLLNGGADAYDACGVVWSNDYDPANFVVYCCTAGYVDVTFRATDPCGLYVETTATATFSTIAPYIDNDGAYSAVSVNAEAGGCTALVSWDAAVVVNGCCDTTYVDYEIDLYNDWAVDATISDPWYTFPSGTHRVRVLAWDDCGEEDYVDFTVTVSDKNELVMDIGLQPTVDTPLSRCITFELSGPDTDTWSEVITFTGGYADDVMVEVPCGDYDCLLVSDGLHTLKRKADDFTIVGTQYVATVTDPDYLLGGNLNGVVYNDYIDILDFGVYVGEYGKDYGTGNTDCSTPYPHADISGNGTVGTEDFSFIQINFLSQNEGCSKGLSPTKTPRADAGMGPVTRISVAELVRLGMADLVVADLNHDGWLDENDITAFLNGARP